jgi:endonuclease YncB( thermonuclease family)
MPPILRPIVALLLALLCTQAFADSFTGRVVRVVDGDTVYVLDASKTQHKIRLAGVDAPEVAQAFGTKAKRRLIELVVGKTVEVNWHKRDKYRRLVGKLIAEGQDVNLAMVRSGLAWWYRKYADEQSPVDRVLYKATEDQTRAKRLGLWIDPHPIPPWEWRHRPSPPEGYAAECPCNSGKVCTGKRGGRFCVRESGTKRYFRRGQ